MIYSKNTSMFYPSKSHFAMKNLLLNLLYGFLGGCMAVGIYHGGSTYLYSNLTPPIQATTMLRQSINGIGPIVPMLDFTTIATRITPAVVHIKITTIKKKGTPPSGWDNDLSKHHNLPNNSGSGVLISNMGYIITNRHVIADAEHIEVTLYDRRIYEAKIIGIDEPTDIALIKIDEPANNFASLVYGDSDKVRVGEWVLAVGNPFNLSSTVTAGIISAKARNMTTLENQTTSDSESQAIEAYIQTDAAVNPGNSGGALVNGNGELIGINTAIATPTGYYAGYSFAVPINIVKKVADDILAYGKVKRGYLGVSIRDLDNNTALQLNITRVKGVFVESVIKGGAADKAGIKNGDVIIQVEDRVVNTIAELQEHIGLFHPNDDISIIVVRDTKPQQMSVKLQGDK